MHTQKVAITIPKELVTMIDNISKKRGLSRSKLISIMLREKLMAERDQFIKDAYDNAFSDELIRKEQRNCVAWFDGVGSDEGQEW
jgi:metal-responsive CopG/Arc/MetJ family transcriptional regulator